MAGTTDRPTAATDDETAPVNGGDHLPDRASRRSPGLDLGRFTTVLLLRAAHPKQVVLTALGLAVGAALTGRPSGEVGLVLATVAVGQAMLGWYDDLVDADRDRRLGTPGKPVASGELEPGSVWFALACAALLVVPLSFTNGWSAGGAYLISLAVALVGDRLLHTGRWSWVPWVLSFALYPAFLSYGGLGGGDHGSPPTILMTLLAGLLGLGVHVLRALPGLVQDHQEGERHLPLRVALRTGAPRLLVLAGVFTGLVVVAMAVTGITVGLSQ